MYVKSLLNVLVQPFYLLIAVLVAGSVFSLAVWLPNFQLLLLVAQTATFTEVLALLWSLYGAIVSNFSVLSATYTISIAVLFGMNVALLTYYIKKMRGGLSGLRRTGSAGVGGLISGAFGIGCAACGTFVLTSVLALFGATGLLVFLPFGGEEFGVLGIGLLGYSIYLLLKKISNPLVCEVT